MNEVISLSASHHANYVLTHLYNTQENHIPYSATADIKFQNQVYLNRNKSTHGSISYTPRAMVYELTGGFGSYSPFQYYESGGPEIPISQSSVIQTRPQISKHEYQRQLDDGGAQVDAASLLTKDTIRYWSDYNKIIYKPSSLMTLSSWSHDSNSHRQFPSVKFNWYHQGVETYQDLSESTQDEFRKNLESCDLVQGINFLSDLDSAWSGFTNAMLVDLKDEFFNNGINNKYNLWSYAFTSPSSQKQQLIPTIHKIKSLVEFSRNSSLFIPLSSPSTNSSLLSQHYDKASDWHTSAVQAFALNSIWGLGNQLGDSVKMATIEDELLRGDNKRNIVNEVSIDHCPDQDDQMSVKLQDVNIMDYYTMPTPPQAAPAVPSKINIGLSAPSDNKKPAISSSHIVSPHSALEVDENLITHKYISESIDDITKVDTFPDVFTQSGSMHVELSQSISLKSQLQDYKKILMRAKATGVIQDIIEDKQELVEELSALIEEYTVGYEDESDDDYDY